MDETYNRFRAALAEALEDEVSATYLCLSDLHTSAKHRQAIIVEVAELVLEPDECKTLVKDAKALRREWRQK